MAADTYDIVAVTACGTCDTADPTDVSLTQGRGVAETRLRRDAARQAGTQRSGSTRRDRRRTTP